MDCFILTMANNIICTLHLIYPRRDNLCTREWIIRVSPNVNIRKHSDSALLFKSLEWSLWKVPSTPFRVPNTPFRVPKGVIRGPERGYSWSRKVRIGMFVLYEKNIKKIKKHKTRIDDVIQSPLPKKTKIHKKQKKKKEKKKKKKNHRSPKDKFIILDKLLKLLYKNTK